MYKEIEPSKGISNIVHRYWRIHTDDVTCKTVKVLPDGCFDIIVDIHTHKKNDVFLSGIWDIPKCVTVNSDAPAAGVRFHPAALGEIINMDISYIKNTAVPFSQDMIKPAGDLSLNILWESDEAKEVVAFFDYYLTYMLKNIDVDVSYLSTAFASDMRVADIADSAFISSRQLRRIFKQRLGISAKRYQNILRFVRAKEILLGSKGESLAQVALSLGYSDQAHFTKEFRKYADITPGCFAAQWKKSVFYNPVD